MEQWATIALRMAAVPGAVEGYLSSLREAAAGENRVASARADRSRPVSRMCAMNVGRGRLLRPARRRRRDRRTELDAARVRTRATSSAARSRRPTPTNPSPKVLRAEHLLDHGHRSRTPAGASCTRCTSQSFLGASRRSRRDLRMGSAGARAHRRGAGRDRRAASGPAPPSPRPIAILDADPVPPARGHRCVARVDAAHVRRCTAGTGRHALRHPRRDPHARVHDRADPARRHLLHRPERGPRHAAGTHVVVGARGRHHLRHLERALDGLSRGRARPSPATRPDHLPPRRAQPVAADGLVAVRPR